MSSNKNVVWRIQYQSYAGKWVNRIFVNYMEAWNFYHMLNTLKLPPYPVSVFDLLQEQTDD